MNIPEERQARREIIDVEAAVYSIFDVAKAVGDRKCQLLNSSRTRFADVVTGNRDGMKARGFPRAKFHHVGYNPQCWSRRADPLFLRDILLEHVVLDRAADLFPW